VVLHRPQGIEPELVGEHPEMHLVGDDLPVGDLQAVAVGLEDHLDADVHPRSSLLAPGSSCGCP
jgi:hypothetical protein